MMKEKFRMKDKMTMTEFLERYFDLEFLPYQKIILNRFKVEYIPSTASNLNEVKNESRRNCIASGNPADVK